LGEPGSGTGCPEAVRSPPEEVSKTQQDKALSNLVWAQRQLCFVEADGLENGDLLQPGLPCYPKQSIASVYSICRWQCDLKLKWKRYSFLLRISNIN